VFGFGPATRIDLAPGATDCGRISTVSTAWCAIIWAVIQKAVTCSCSQMRAATVSNFWYMTEAAYKFVRRS
jgi:hypothetical protein